MPVPRPRTKVGRFLQAPASDKRLLTEAFVELWRARILLWLVPFSRLQPALGVPMTETLAEVEEGVARSARRVGRTIDVAARHVPWDSACLARALAVRRMLHRRGLPATVYLGVRRASAKDGLTAHAWVRCGRTFVVGGDGHEAYTVTATFASFGAGQGVRRPQQDEPA